MLLITMALIGGIGGSAVDLFLSNAYRTHPIFRRPSRCTNCRTPSRAIEWLPILGGLLQPRCRVCGSSLLPRFLALTVGGAIVFLLAYIELDGLLVGLLGGVFCLVLLALTSTDVERRLLPDRIVLPAIVLALCAAWLFPDLTFTGVLIGGGVGLALAAGLLLLSLPFGTGALGMGDLKVVVLLGFLLGFQSLLVGLFVASLSAGLFAFVLLVARFRRFGEYIPHGPFLALGGILGLLLGPEIWDWYAN